MNRCPADAIHLVLLDDERLLRDALASNLNSQPDMRVVYAGENGQTGVRACLDSSPEVAVIDIDLQDRDPFDIATQVSAQQRATRFLFIANQASDITVEQAIRVQACGFLLKHEPLEVLIASIRRINRGQCCFSRELEKRVVYNRNGHFYAICKPTALSSLTDRQLEVLRRLALGERTKETARAMNLAEKSVDSHKYRIMQRLGIHDRVELARLAIREGLVRV